MKDLDVTHLGALVYVISREQQVFATILPLNSRWFVHCAGWIEFYDEFEHALASVEGYDLFLKGQEIRDQGVKKRLAEFVAKKGLKLR